MASRLPTLPRIVFTVLEPISLIGGFVPAVFFPDWFINEQLAQPAAVASPENSRLVAQQLGNAYGLLFMVGVAVLYTTSELKVVRNYLMALLIADIGHVAVTYLALQHDKFMAVSQWNAMTWGNVGATTCLAMMRAAYLLGLFGPDAQPAASQKKAN